MEFRIADTFTDSLARLTAEEQKAAKTTAFDLQMDPVNPGMQLHRLDRAKDKNFWSVRVGSDLRLIVHKTADSLLLCYVAHHDKAYAWAERRKLETHPQTGAAQMVEIREHVQEITVLKRVETEHAAPEAYQFSSVSEAELLSYGVPNEWLADVRRADGNSYLALIDHLPAEAAEALFQLATGGKPQTAQPAVKGTDPFAHPDAQRRFRVMKDVQELERALEYPWDKWTVFLHPAQRQMVERDYTGPARVAGSAGTGKTIVALHRAVHLARRHRDARVLLTTFSKTLANALGNKLRLLIHNEPHLGENIEVLSINALGRRLHKLHCEPAKIAPHEVVNALLADAAKTVEGHKFTQHFLRLEWEEVVDAWQLESWEAYRGVRRLGRKTRMPEAQRAQLWAIFERVRAELKTRGMMTQAEMFTRLATQLTEHRLTPFNFVVVDEAQDVSIAQLRLLAALGARQPNGLFLAGDLGQRIFQQPFSWLALGVDVRGRSRTLNINYRTSHQIRRQADLLLETEISDVDGNTEERSNTISVFNGPTPTIRILESVEQETESVCEWLIERIKEGVRPDEIGVFVRSIAEFDRAHQAVAAAKLSFKVLDENIVTTDGHVSISTMHLAKGLEFRAVAVMACDDEIIPRQERIEAATDETELKEVHDTERHLLYVACTRARDYLIVTSVAPASEFLDDLQMSK